MIDQTNFKKKSYYESRHGCSDAKSSGQIIGCSQHGQRANCHGFSPLMYKMISIRLNVLKWLTILQFWAISHFNSSIESIHVHMHHCARQIPGLFKFLSQTVHLHSTKTVNNLLDIKLEKLYFGSGHFLLLFSQFGTSCLQISNLGINSFLIFLLVLIKLRTFGSLFNDLINFSCIQSLHPSFVIVQFHDTQVLVG